MSKLYAILISIFPPYAIMEVLGLVP